MKKKWAIATLAVCGLVLAGCSTGNSSKKEESKSSDTAAVAKKQVFNMVEGAEMPSADLSLATDEVSFSALNNCYEGLYRLDKDNKPIPAGAAEMAKVSDDGLTYTLKLREDAKWSNGDPVTAKDYVYGWQRTVDPKTASEYAYLFEPVANASDITAGKKATSELGIKAVDDYTLEIKLAKVTPYFDQLLAFPIFFPQNQKVVEKFGSDYATKSENAVYNGPFTLEGFDGPGTDTEWSYAKNDTYWDAKNVKLDKINVSVIKESSTALNLFKDGQSDQVTLNGELAQQMANDEAFLTIPEASTFYLEFNQKDEKSPYRNANLRKAISYAINRDSLAKQVLANGSIATTNLMPEKFIYDPKTKKDFVKEAKSPVKYDKKKAKEYWEKAKKELGVDEVKLDILSSDSDVAKKMLEYLQGSLQENLPGLKVSVSPVPFSVRLDRSNKGDFDTVLSGWGADYADASSFLDMFTIGNSYNRGNWNNEEYTKLVRAAATTDAADEEKRWDDFVKAEKIIMDEQGVVPIYQKAVAYMRNPKVKGIVNHPAGAKYDFKWTYIAK